MTGMLIGVAALSAWGLYHQLNPGDAARHRRQQPGRQAGRGGGTLPDRLRDAVRLDLLHLTVIVSLVGAVRSLFIGGRRARAADKHAEESAPAPG